MLNSLRARIMVSTAVLLTLMMSAVGVWLYQSFNFAQMDSLKDKLRLHSFSVLALADVQHGQFRLPEFLPEGRFNESGSGLYARVINGSFEQVWQSRSADNIPPFEAVEVKAGEWFYSLARRGDHEYLLARYGVSFGLQKNDHFVLTVVEDLSALQRQLYIYRNSLILALGMFGGLLLLMQWLVLRWGLAPLRLVTAKLQRLQQGEESDLAGAYPKELQPLTSNLNQLLQNEQAQRERYRNQLADLSHSLKTPLAVITGLVSEPQLDEADRQELQAQAGLMDERIRFQLQRAVSQAGALSIHRTAVKPVLESLCSALTKVYAGRPVHIRLQCGAQQFGGDENDLMEIAGNLLDNACKYGNGQVAVSCGDLEHGWYLKVEDNGPGIATDRRAQILQRGVRLDTMETGQGLGLALVADILPQYRGQLSICGSALGGACFCVEFSTEERESA